MENWYCGRGRVVNPSEGEEDSTSSGDSSSPSVVAPVQSTGCRSPICRQHNPPSKSGSSFRGEGHRPSSRSDEYTKAPRSPKKSYSAIEIDGRNHCRFGSAPNLERDHDWCSECIESAQYRRKGSLSNGYCPSPSTRRKNMEHLPVSPNAEPFYPSKSPFKKRFNAEKKRKKNSRFIYGFWCFVVVLALVLYFVLLGETLMQRKVVNALHRLLTSSSSSSSNETSSSGR